MNTFMRISIQMLFCFMLLAILPKSYGQLFKGEVIIGGNLSQMEGDRVHGYRKIGFCGGLGIQFPFRFNPENPQKPWSVSMEILFNQRGAKQKNYNYNPADTSIEPATKYKFKYLLKNNYVCLPFMLHYTDKEIYSIGMGLSYNRLVSSKEIEFDVEQTYDSVPTFKPYDLTFVVDARCRVWQQLKVGFRFEYSITPIRTRAFSSSTFYYEEVRKQYNNSLSLYLVYVFNEKRKNVDKDKEPRKKVYYY